MTDWLGKIKKVLGIFWSKMFGDYDFILGVEKAAALLGCRQEMACLNWYMSRIQKELSVRQSSLPYVMYIRCDGIHVTWADFKDILSGSKTLGDTDASLGWTAPCKEIEAAPDWISTHVLGAGSILVGGVDYTFENNTFRFLTDPSKLGFDTVTFTDDGGAPYACYRIFGWRIDRTRSNDAVAGFISPKLSADSDLAWDMHVRGVTCYSAKQLLARCTGSAVCLENGSVDHVWNEQDISCVLVGEHVYCAPYGTSINVSHGDTVHKGDVLMGSLRVYGATDSPSAADVPGIRVRTDAGELTALNSEQDAYTDGSIRMLPLQGDAATVLGYKARCRALSADSHALYIEIPSRVNAFNFIRDKLRSRRSLYISLAADSLGDVEPALDCMRSGTSASAMVTVFIRASGEAVSASVQGFTAYAGMAAVAEYGTVKIMQSSSEVRYLV